MANLPARRLFGVLVLLGAFGIGACEGVPGSDLASLEVSYESELETDAGKVKFQGTVDDMKPDTWMVASQPVSISLDTEIDPTIVLGDLVEVEAFVREDGTLLAGEISLFKPRAPDGDKARDEVGGELEFIGVVQAMSDSSWTIDGEVVSITSQTEIEPGIAVQDLVKVHASFLEDQTIQAREIEFVDDEQDVDGDGEEEAEQIEFTGIIEEMGVTQWVVDGVELEIAPDTEIDPGLAVGDMVKVQAWIDAEGSFIAREIERSEEDMSSEDSDSEDEEELKGVVETIGDEQWIVDGQVVLITLQTEIEEDILVGDLIKVEGFQQEDGSWLAFEIELSDDDDLTDDDFEDEDEDSDEDDGYSDEEEDHEGDDEHEDDEHYEEEDDD